MYKFKNHEMLEDNVIFDYFESAFSLNRQQVLFANFVIKSLNKDYNSFHFIDDYSANKALKEHFSCEVKKSDVSYTLDKLEYELSFIEKHYKNDSYKLTHWGMEVIQKHSELISYFSFELQNRLEKIKEKQEEINLKYKIDNLTLKQLEGSIFQIKKWWLILIINALVTIVVTVIVAII